MENQLSPNLGARCLITTRNHSLFDWKTRQKTNHFDIWSI
jgi:hypothetical protein